jgi:hypothetical protein
LLVELEVVRGVRGVDQDPLLVFRVKVSELPVALGLNLLSDRRPDIIAHGHVHNHL